MLSPPTPHTLAMSDDQDGPRFRARRFNLSPVPLQFPSLSHADAAIERLYLRGEAVEGLRPATVRWLRDGYRSFRAFLRDEAPRETTFLGGNAVNQVQLIEDWIAWLRMRGVSHEHLHLLAGARRAVSAA